MNRLTPSQIEALTELLAPHALSPDLYDDLLDHYCCAVEAEMAGGKDFAEATACATRQICPNGPQEIQSEYLHSHLKINPMKKFMYIISFIAAVGFTTGVLFKTLHLPGASVLIVPGTVLFVFTLLPLIFYNTYKSEKNPGSTAKIKVAFGYLGFSLVLVGFLFKMMHWPTAHIQLMLGIIMLNLVYFPLVFLKMYRRSAG